MRKYEVFTSGTGGMILSTHFTLKSIKTKEIIFALLALRLKCMRHLSLLISYAVYTPKIKICAAYLTTCRWVAGKLFVWSAKINQNFLHIIFYLMYNHGYIHQAILSSDRSLLVCDTQLWAAFYKPDIRCTLVSILLYSASCYTNNSE